MKQKWEAVQSAERTARGSALQRVAVCRPWQRWGRAAPTTDAPNRQVRRCCAQLGGTDGFGATAQQHLHPWTGWRRRACRGSMEIGESKRSTRQDTKQRVKQERHDKISKKSEHTGVDSPAPITSRCSGLAGGTVQVLGGISTREMPGGATVSLEQQKRRKKCPLSTPPPPSFSFPPPVKCTLD